jgi:hypothetical protein
MILIYWPLWFDKLTTNGFGRGRIFAVWGLFVNDGCLFAAGAAPAHGMRLHVEAKMHDISVLDDVILAFDA